MLSAQQGDINAISPNASLKVYIMTAIQQTMIYNIADAAPTQLASSARTHHASCSSEQQIQLQLSNQDVSVQPRQVTGYMRTQLTQM